MRNHPGALNPRIKSLNYLNNILAKIEGTNAGCLEALMLNHKGEVAECTGDNIFVVRRGELHTPSIDAGILEGITRDAVIELARGAGLTVVERSMDRHDIYTADECFLTGTAAEVIPVVECDGRPSAPASPARSRRTSSSGSTPWSARPAETRGRALRVIAIRTILAPTDFSPPRRDRRAVCLRPGRAARRRAAPAARPVRRRPRRPRPDAHARLPPEYYRESEEQSRETLGRVARPVVGRAADRPDGRRLGRAPSRGSSTTPATTRSTSS